MKIKFVDGHEYEAKTASDLIQQLKLEDYQGGNYRNNVKQRVKLWNGMEIEYSTDEEFISELERVGVVEVIHS